MLIVFVRTTVIFVTLLVIMRLMGKRQIGEMQPFEFVITLIIADLACIPMSEVSIPLLYGISAIIALFVLHQVLSLLEECGAFMKRAISGKPSLVINSNGIDFTELKRNDIDVGDLIESLRAQGCFSPEDVSYAIFESNGKLSVLKKSASEKEKGALSVTLIDGGKLNDKNLSLLRIGKEELISFVKNQKAKSYKSVGLMTIDGNGRVYFQKYGEKYKILKMPLKEGVSW